MEITTEQANAVYEELVEAGWLYQVSDVVDKMLDAGMSNGEVLDRAEQVESFMRLVKPNKVHDIVSKVEGMLPDDLEFED